MSLNPGAGTSLHRSLGRESPTANHHRAASWGARTRAAPPKGRSCDVGLMHFFGLDVSPNIPRISSGSYGPRKIVRTEKSSNLHSRFCVVAGFEVHRLFTVCRKSMTGLVLTPTCSPFARALACRRIEGAQGGRVARSSHREWGSEGRGLIRGFWALVCGAEVSPRPQGSERIRGPGVFAYLRCPESHNTKQPGHQAFPTRGKIPRHRLPRLPGPRAVVKVGQAGHRHRCPTKRAERVGDDLNLCAKARRLSEDSGLRVELARNLGPRSHPLSALLPGRPANTLSGIPRLQIHRSVDR